MASMSPDGRASLEETPSHDFRKSLRSDRTASPNRQERPVPENTTLQIAWDKSMEGVGGVGLPHRNTAVLMISWADELDDLHTTDEVEALASVFENKFRYTVVKKKLAAGKRPQIQVQKHLVNFVDEYDSSNTLLIVYYAGHGIRGQPGQLTLAGKRRPEEKSNIRNSVVWDEAEPIIKAAEADVLVIFDCCFAGNLAKVRNRAYSERKFEFLAACGSGSTTAMPGPRSFTSALIYALEVLVETRPQFTTMELQRKINHEAPKFPEKQHAELIERDDPCLQKLVLAPLPKPGEETEIAYAPENERKTNPIKRYLELRFFYDQIPDEEEILRLSAGLQEMMRTRRISTRHVGWAGLKTTETMIRNVTKHWRRMTMKDKVSPWLESPTSPSAAPNGLSPLMAPLHTPPPSDAGTIDVPESSPQQESTNIAIENFNNFDVHVTGSANNALKGSDYRVRILIVGLVSMLLECFRRLRPAEAPAMVLLFFCGYAWYMTALHERTTSKAGTTWTSSYFSLIIAGISLFICTHVLLAEGGVLR